MGHRTLCQGTFGSSDEPILRLCWKLDCGPNFSRGSIWAGHWAASLAKLSDFDSISFCGSVQVSQAQISKLSSIGSRDMGKKLTKSGLFWAQFIEKSQNVAFGYQWRGLRRVPRDELRVCTYHDNSYRKCYLKSANKSIQNGL